MGARYFSASASVMQIGAPEGFPLVITSTSGIAGSCEFSSSGYRNRSMCTGVYGSITPILGFPGASASLRTEAPAS